LSAAAGLPWTAPDFTEAVVGFRQWRLVDGELCSVYSPTVWATAELGAICNRDGHDPADTPAEDCDCGIYAYYDPCPRGASAGTPDLIGGAVIVWGRIEVYATGMRAERARIVALELPLSRGAKRRTVIAVAERLGVPATPHRELKGLALAQGTPLQPSLRPPRTRGAAANPWQLLDPS
jgi:hypothetical protein